MRAKLRMKRMLAVALTGALALSLLPGAAFADVVDFDDIDACEGAPDAGFTDVLAGSTSANFINCIAYYGITAGTGDTTYSPANTVTRRQMALFIARLATQATEGTTDIPEYDADAFDDISGIGTAEARNAINFIADLGITVGTTGGESYNPNGPVTRQQMASFIARAHEALGVFDELGDDFEVDEDRFADIDDASTQHQDNINILAAAGVVEGVGDGNFNPRGEVNRRQMSAFLGRSIGVLESVGLWNGEPIVDPDEPPLADNPTFTDAPELVSVTKGTAGVVTFEFDNDVPGIAVAPANFRLYDTNANVTPATSASVSGSTVTVRYGTAQEPNVGAVASAIRAGVRTGTVADATGLLSIASGFPLTATAAQIAPIDPDLVSVGNYRFADDIALGEQRVLVDFVFDDADGALVALTSDNNGGPDVDFADFSLIGSQSTEFEAINEPLIVNRDDAANTTTVTVAFADDPTEVPQGQLRRGVFAPAALDVIWSASFGTTAGTTVDPDLVSVEREGTSNIFRFVFDESVSALAAEIDPSQFYIVDSGLNEQVATVASRSAVAGDGARVMRVRFGAVAADLTIGIPVHAYVDARAVRATDSTDTDNQGYNQPAASSITIPVLGDPEPGVTAGLDLVSAQRVEDAVTNRFTIRLTFNESLTLANVTGGNYEINLYDAAGVRFEVDNFAAGVTVAGADSEVLVITSDNADLTDDQLEATVTASVQTVNPATSPAPMTEGQVDAQEIVVQ